MHLKNNLAKNAFLFIAFLALLLLTLPNVLGQQSFGNKGDYSDEEINQFIEANKTTSQIQEKNQKKMMETIQKEGIEIEKFNQIMNAQQKEEEVNASETEIAAFNKAMQNLQVIQKEMEQKIESLLETGIGVEKYKEMMLAYQKDSDFQQRVNSFLN